MDFRSKDPEVAAGGGINPERSRGWWIALGLVVIGVIGLVMVEGDIDKIINFWFTAVTPGPWDATMESLRVTAIAATQTTGAAIDATMMRLFNDLVGTATAAQGTAIPVGTPIP